MTTTRRLVVPRSARYVTEGEPDGEIDDVWFLLHGYAQLAAEFLGLSRALVRTRRLLVAPEALSRFYHEDHETVGASWMTREDREHEIEDYVRYLDLLHDEIFSVVPRESVRLSVLGFSQGAATAARWAVRGEARVEHLVLWGSRLPPELDDEASTTALRAMKLSLVGGTRDRFLTAETWDAERVRLRRLGLAFEEVHFEGGHRLDDDTLRRIGA